MSDSTPEKESFFIKLPAFVLFSKADGTPLVAKADGRKNVLLFTDLDSAETFVERSQVECAICPLPDAKEVRRFLSGFKPDDMVVMDPLDDKLRTVTGYTVAQVLASIVN